MGDYRVPERKYIPKTAFQIQRTSPCECLVKAVFGYIAYISNSIYTGISGLLQVRDSTGNPDRVTPKGKVSGVLDGRSLVHY